MDYKGYDISFLPPLNLIPGYASASDGQYVRRVETVNDLYKYCINIILPQLSVLLSKSVVGGGQNPKKCRALRELKNHALHSNVLYSN